MVVLLQTEKGSPGKSSIGRTSFSGQAIGNIRLIIDGETTYTITGDNRIHVDEPTPNEPYERTFVLDGGAQTDGDEN